VVRRSNGERRTLPLAARYADEWNANFVSLERFRELNRRLDQLLEQEGRSPASVRRTLMTGVRLGRDDAEIRARFPNHAPEEARRRGVLFGTVRQIKDQIAALEDAGVQRVMLQWLDLDDLAGVQRLAETLQ
jgi:alkanesulfonate monooxygenase SsuD/methylene tetrahydromethanopterin reductase-like flavin-dependent oxidoreductase (luciferase family)